MRRRRRRLPLPTCPEPALRMPRSSCLCSLLREISPPRAVGQRPIRSEHPSCRAGFPQVFRTSQEGKPRTGDVSPDTGVKRMSPPSQEGKQDGFLVLMKERAPGQKVGESCSGSPAGKTKAAPARVAGSVGSHSRKSSCPLPRPRPDSPAAPDIHVHV